MENRRSRKHKLSYILKTDSQDSDDSYHRGNGTFYVICDSSIRTVICDTSVPTVISNACSCVLIVIPGY